MGVSKDITRRILLKDAADQENTKIVFEIKAHSLTRDFLYFRRAVRTNNAAIMP